MNIQTLLFISCIGLFIYSGISIFKQYKESSGIFFLSFIICLLFWIILASASYDSSFSSNFLVLSNQLSYWLSFSFFLSITLFFLFLNRPFSQVVKIFCYYIFFTFFLLYIFTQTDAIVRGIEYSDIDMTYREIYGPYFIALQAFFILIPFILGGVAFYTIKKQSFITRVRLTWLIIGFITTATVSILFLIVFPVFFDYHYEGEVIFFLIPLIFGVLFSSRKYVFSTFRGIFSKIYIFFLLIFVSAGSVISIKNLAPYFGFGRETPVVSDDIGIYEIILYSFFFLIVNRFIQKKIKSGDHFLVSLKEIESKVPFTTTIEDLNFLIQEQFKLSFGVKKVHISLQKGNSSDKFFFYYFNSGKRKEFFLNDKVFIEENIITTEERKLLEEVSLNHHLVFPFYEKEKFIGYLTFDKKPFNGYYSREEVATLKHFVHFVQGHLKYIGIYKEIHDLNLNLEKRVDDKTIEYNAIISRQKEFIEVVSHEVRTPLATALFQAECLENDLKPLSFTKKRTIIHDLKSLYNKIVDTVDLVNKLFSIERFEANKAQLFKEEVDIVKLFKTKLQSYVKINKGIDFQFTQSGGTIDFVKIDIIQFKQVFDNLITNAIKFSSKSPHPKISIKLVKKKKDIIFTIEDSGLGFSGIDISNLFNKYNTGNSSSIGLGMGLYLCKKIVELHGGVISAAKSKTLGGALFKIVLPTSPK